jgi:hypothetical protein
LSNVHGVARARPHALPVAVVLGVDAEDAAADSNGGKTRVIPTCIRASRAIDRGSTCAPPTY